MSTRCPSASPSMRRAKSTGSRTVSRIRTSPSSTSAKPTGLAGSGPSVEGSTSPAGTFVVSGLITNLCTTRDGNDTTWPGACSDSGPRSTVIGFPSLMTTSAFVMTRSSTRTCGCTSVTWSACTPPLRCVKHEVLVGRVGAADPPRPCGGRRRRPHRDGPRRPGRRRRWRRRVPPCLLDDRAAGVGRAGEQVEPEVVAAGIGRRLCPRARSAPLLSRSEVNHSWMRRRFESVITRSAAGPQRLAQLRRRPSTPSCRTRAGGRRAGRRRRRRRSRRRRRRARPAASTGAVCTIGTGSVTSNSATGGGSARSPACATFELVDQPGVCGRRAGCDGSSEHRRRSSPGATWVA